MTVATQPSPTSRKRKPGTSSLSLLSSPSSSLELESELDSNISDLSAPPILIPPPTYTPQTHVPSQEEREFNELLSLETFSILRESAPDLPAPNQSIQELCLTGLTRSTASEVYNDYRARPVPNINPSTLLHYVFGHISCMQPHHHLFTNSKHSKIVISIGIGKEMQDVVLNPEYGAMLQMRDLHFWIEVLRGNYLRLLVELETGVERRELALWVLETVGLS